MALLSALYAFYLEHQYCGDLDSGVETDYVWMTCTCGAQPLGLRRLSRLVVHVVPFS